LKTEIGYSWAYAIFHELDFIAVVGQVSQLGCGDDVDIERDGEQQ